MELKRSNKTKSNVNIDITATDENRPFGEDLNIPRGKCEKIVAEKWNA